MRFHGTVTVNDLPSPAALLGTAGRASLLNAINSTYRGTEVFGTAIDPFKDISNSFIKNIIEPARQSIQLLSSAVKSIFDRTKSGFCILESLQDFIDAPEDMHLGIMYYKPIAELLDSGSIIGYKSVNAQAVLSAPEDPFIKSLANGYTEDVTAVDGEYLTPYTIDFHPAHELLDLDAEDAHALQMTRNNIDRLLISSKFDPTSGYERP